MRLAYAIAITCSACIIEVDYAGTAFLCSDEECPAGFTCVAGACVATGVTCSEILENNPNAASGAYQLENGVAYCDMDTLGGGWTRVVAFAAEDSDCPGNWVTELDAPRRCVRATPDAANVASAATFAALHEYSEVMGFVRGFQRGTVDSFEPAVGKTLDDVYVDGVSITTASSLAGREHIWTFAGGEYSGDCPCGGGASVPSFVGSNYYCETASPAGSNPALWYFDDILWDADVEGEDTCELNGSPSRFQMTLAAPVSADIEVRIMTDSPIGDEFVGLSELELFVR